LKNFRAAVQEFRENRDGVPAMGLIRIENGVEGRQAEERQRPNCFPF
jgi:hypothetical protein